MTIVKIRLECHSISNELVEKLKKRPDGTMNDDTWSIDTMVNKYNDWEIYRVFFKKGPKVRGLKSIQNSVSDATFALSFFVTKYNFISNQ